MKYGQVCMDWWQGRGQSTSFELSGLWEIPPCSQAPSGSRGVPPGDGHSILCCFTSWRIQHSLRGCWEKNEGSLGAWRAELGGIEGEKQCGHVEKEPLASKRSRSGLEPLLEEKSGAGRANLGGREMARECRCVSKSRGITLERDFERKRALRRVSIPPRTSTQAEEKLERLLGNKYSVLGLQVQHPVDHLWFFGRRFARAHKCAEIQPHPMAKPH